MGILTTDGRSLDYSSCAVKRGSRVAFSESASKRNTPEQTDTPENPLNQKAWL